MRKTLIAALATIAAGPLLAHEGAHIHPHADHPVWLPVVIGLLAVGCALTLRGRFK
jgi:hypothetical protein